MNAAELLLPALRWDAERGYAGQRELIDTALELGVGGFIYFGGPSAAVRALAEEVSARSRVPLLLGADLERGAGQQFAGETGLPPLAALGALRDAEVMRRAAALTARESRKLGINWVYAPVLDLDVEPDNPIVGTRSIGDEPAAVAALGAAWIEGCQSERVLACGKHFPGHGRTTTDSHAELPVVTAGADVLERTDLVPFSRAIASGVASIMSAHVTFPALDPSGAPATLSRPILTELLRGRLGFEELIVTDALIMAGVLEHDPEPRAAVRALAAGCDLLLYPEDLRGVLREVTAAVERGELDEKEIQRSLGRRRKWAEWAAAAPELPGTELDQESGAWAAELACSVVHAVGGAVPPLAGTVELTVIDDDLGGPYPPPSREPFADRLRELGVEVREAGPGDSEAGRSPARAGSQPGSTRVVALFGDIRAWKGRPGYSERALAEVGRAVAGSDAAQTVLVQFSHPRLAALTRVGCPVASAWGGEATMQRAAADWLVHRCRR